MKAVYERILEAIQKDGTLAEGFSIQQSRAPGNLQFVDGATDGIIRYHGGTQANKDLVKQLIKIAKRASAGADRTTLSNKLDKLFLEKDEMLCCIDEVQYWLIQHSEQFSKIPLFESAFAILKTAGTPGAVKYALSILELMARVGGEWRRCIRVLALSDEFTLFCIFVASQWENRNQELFGMAKKVRGWGRIHAVEVLEAENQEMREWLLNEGWKNNVLPAYSAAACAVKGNLKNRLLKKELSTDEFIAAGGLLQALLDEGPLPGISDPRLVNPRELPELYLIQAEKRELSLADYEIIADIRKAAAEKGWTEVENRAYQILNSIS